MAVVSVKQIGAGRNADGRSDFNRSYTVVWVVIVDDPYDGPATVGSAATLPARFAPYVGYENTNDAFALCTSLRPEQDGEEWYKWRVTATFETQFTQNQHQHEDPSEEPPVFWVETEFTTKPVVKEWNGNDIKNSAGQLIAGLEKLEAVETWVWEKNHTSLNRSFWLAYQNTVNSDNFFELEPKQGLLHIIVPKASYRNGAPFWRVQYRVKVNKDGWDVEPADRGTAVKNASGKLERPTDEKGQPFDGEVPLKADGTQERDSTVAQRYLTAKDLYEPKAFSALGLT
jgi:hypothetical protein